MPSSRTKHQYFGVCSRVAKMLALVARTCNHFTVVHHNGADRYIAVSGRTLRFSKRMAHCGYIIHIPTVRLLPLRHSVR
ncbi:hypothetical protein LBMAG03_13280 [Actinomycetes bacterium]|nr:hypothetical protein LBMAG03_13280 [Actinomycetes bacterium]